MLGEEQVGEVERVVGEFCRTHPPAPVRDKLQYVYRFAGQAVVLAERRPAYISDLGWTETPVAKFRYTKNSASWSLYWSDRNGRWHVYDLARPAKRLATLFSEVRRDPTGIFFG